MSMQGCLPLSNSKVIHLPTKKILDRTLLHIHPGFFQKWLWCIKLSKVKVGGVGKKKKSDTFAKSMFTLELIRKCFYRSQAVSRKSLCESCCQIQAIWRSWVPFKQTPLESTPNVKSICSTHLKLSSVCWMFYANVCSWQLGRRCGLEAFDMGCRTGGMLKKINK